eukprot:gene9859-18444_t
MVVLEHLHKKSDENEQDSRCSCLRIVNVPLPKQGGKENCEKKVKQIMKDINCGLNPDDIDHAHRIGSKRTDDNGVVSQQIIVKFKSFRQRTMLYRNRGKAKNDIQVGPISKAASAEEVPLEDFLQIVKLHIVEKSTFASNYQLKTIVIDSSVFESRKVFTETVTAQFGSAFVVNGAITKADLSDYILHLKDQYLRGDQQQSFKIAHFTGLVENDYWYLSQEKNNAKSLEKKTNLVHFINNVKSTEPFDEHLLAYHEKLYQGSLSRGLEIPESSGILISSNEPESES